MGRGRTLTNTYKAVAGAVLIASAILVLTGCSDMAFSEKNYHFAENQKKTIGFYIVSAGKYKIEEITKEGDTNNRFTLEYNGKKNEEICKAWEGEVKEPGKEVLGCLFTAESSGLQEGEQVTLTAKYERLPATVETPVRATLERP